MRIDQFLTDKNYGSRKMVKRMLLQKRVQIDGKSIMNGSFDIEPFVQEVLIDGEIWQEKIHDYFLLHKPAGVVSAVKDECHQTVVDLIHPTDYSMPLFPVGRLDRDATGLVLLTNNGKLAYQLMHPKYHVVKKYEVAVNGYLSSVEIQRFSEGITFEDGTKCRSSKLEIEVATEDWSKATVEISEGKFHQVKKMFLCVGCKVLSLKRLSMGSLQLDEQLEPGQYRALQKEELRKLWKK